MKCMYVCMCVCAYVRMCVCVYVCICVCRNIVMYFIYSGEIHRTSWAIQTKILQVGNPIMLIHESRDSYMMVKQLANHGYCNGISWCFLFQQYDT